jgi:hypothetical protein
MGRLEDGHVPARPARSIARAVAQAHSGPGSETPLVASGEGPQTGTEVPRTTPFVP